MFLSLFSYFTQPSIYVPSSLIVRINHIVSYAEDRFPEFLFVTSSKEVDQEASLTWQMFESRLISCEPNLRAKDSSKSQD